MRNNRLGFLFLFFVVSIAGSSCATQGYNKGQFNLMSIDEEAKWGNELKAQVDQEFAAKDMLYQNREVDSYITRLGNKLLSYAPEVDFDYTFSVVKTDEVNAFAIPGGHIYVNTALIAEAENEAELAGVISHEIGHVVARHGSERLSALMAVSTAGSVLVGSQDDAMKKMLTDLALQITTTGGMLAYSRANENEADQIGAKIMYKAGYNPYAMVKFFDRLHDKTGDMSRFDVFLSTHPDPEDRRNKVKDFIKQNYPDARDLELDTPEFDQVRTICEAIRYPGKKSD